VRVAVQENAFGSNRCRIRIEAHPGQGDGFANHVFGLREVNRSYPAFVFDNQVHNRDFGSGAAHFRDLANRLAC